MPGNDKPSGTVIVGGVIALGAIALAAILFSSSDDVGTQRIALLLAIIGPAIASLVGMLRADVAAGRLNGELDQRIEAGVYRAQAVRRANLDMPGGPATNVAPAPREGQ